MRLCVLSLLVFLAAAAGPGPAAPPGPGWRDADGKLRRNLAVPGGKAVVLIFITNDCPISNAYAPEINRIAAAYTLRKAPVFLVHVDRDTPLAAVRAHARAYGYRGPILLDGDHRLVHRVGATVTPEAAVLAPDGRLLYRGRIDDRYVDFGIARVRANHHDLREALDAVLAGRPVPHPITKAIGCFIGAP